MICTEILGLNIPCVITACAELNELEELRSQYVSAHSVPEYIPGFPEVYFVFEAILALSASL